MDMENRDYADYCFGVDLADVDPDINEIISLEEERQARKFVFIPSESIAPKAVRQALGSVFNYSPIARSAKSPPI